MNNNGQNLDPNINWQAILLHLKKQKLVPFLGAGASMGFGGSTGLPSGSELSRALAEECGYPGTEKDDLLRVSQYYALSIGEMDLRDAVIDKLNMNDIQPGEVHNILAGWPIVAVLTTNFDNLMERAFEEKSKKSTMAIYDRQGDQEQIVSEPAVENPLVYKLHGSMDDPDSLIITEDNYIDFMISLMNHNPKVPDAISQIFRTCGLLFIGYGLRDWNIRVLLRYFQVDRRSFAIQRSLEADNDNDAAREWDSTVLYWEQKKISVYNCDALEFLRELDKRYQEDKEEPKDAG